MNRHLSVSQLSMLAKCPQQYEWRYIKGIKSPPGVAAVIGKGTHQSVEKNLRAKMETGELLTPEAVEDAAADAVRSEWEVETPMLDADERREGEDAVKGEAIDTAVALARLHRDKLAPAIKPVALEAEFRIQIEGLPEILGYKDIEEAKTIRDTKTAGKAPSADEADTSVQLTAYALESTLRGDPKDVALDYLVKGRNPKALTLTSTRDEVDFSRFVRRVELASKMIDSGIFPPTDPKNWACSPKWCGYWDRCEFGGRRAVSVLISASNLTKKAG